LRVNEGDMVSAGQIVALMDVKDLEATLKRSEAQVLQAQRVVDEARAAQEQQRTQAALAKQQLERTSYLVERGNATSELLDKRRQQLDSANAGLDAATARIAQAEHALNSAQEAVEPTKVISPTTRWWLRVTAASSTGLLMWAKSLPPAAGSSP
jgi:HlyD family secretion protein